MVYLLVFTNLIFLAPAFLVILASPNVNWLIVMTLALSGFFLYNGLALSGQSCGNSMMAFATAEPADRWLENLLAVSIAAALRGLTLLVGGWMELLFVRIPVGLLTLLVLSVYAYRLLYIAEHVFGFVSCRLD